MLHVRQDLLQLPADIRDLWRTLSLFPPKLQQICTSYNSNQFAGGIHNRNLPPTALDHEPMKLTDRSVLADRMVTLAHYLVNRQRPQSVRNRTVRLSSGQDSNQFIAAVAVPLYNRETFVAVTLHQLHRGSDRHLFVQRMWTASAHDLGYPFRCARVLL